MGPRRYHSHHEESHDERAHRQSCGSSMKHNPPFLRYFLDRTAGSFWSKPRSTRQHWRAEQSDSGGTLSLLGWACQPLLRLSAARQFTNCKVDEVPRALQSGEISKSAVKNTGFGLGMPSSSVMAIVNLASRLAKCFYCVKR